MKMRTTNPPATRIAAAMAASLAVALFLAGCATTLPPITEHPDLLNFLADGKTTKEEVLMKLGRPSAKFENEKILTYRLGFKSRNMGYYIIEKDAESSFGWNDVTYSLVLVFDDQEVLRKHSLVEVRR